MTSPAKENVEKKLVDIDPGLSASVRLWLRRHGKSPRFKLSKEREKEFRDCFLFMDTDNSGELSRDELSAAFRLLGFAFTESELRALMKEADEDDSGLIDMPEFVEIMTETTRKAASLATSDQTSYSMPFASLATEYRRKRYLDAVKTERGLRELVTIQERLQEEELKEARLAEEKAKRRLRSMLTRQGGERRRSFNSIRRSDWSGHESEFSRSASLAGNRLELQRSSSRGSLGGLSLKSQLSGRRGSMGGQSEKSLCDDSEDGLKVESSQAPQLQAKPSAKRVVKEDRRLAQLHRLDRVLAKDDPSLRHLSHRQLMLLSRASRVGIDPKALDPKTLSRTSGASSPSPHPPHDTDGGQGRTVEIPRAVEARPLRPASAQPWASRPVSSLRGKSGFDPNLSLTPDPCLQITFTRPILNIKRPSSSPSNRSITSPRPSPSPVPSLSTHDELPDRLWSSLSLYSQMDRHNSPSPSTKALVPRQRPPSSREKAITYAQKVAQANADKAIERKLRSPSPSPHLVPPHLRSQQLQSRSASPLSTSFQPDLSFHIATESSPHNRFPDPNC